MKIRTFRAEVQLRQEPEEVFEFFSNPQNLNEITPRWLHFSIQTRMPVEMKEGTILDYRLKIRGLPVSWKSKITIWNPPVLFVDFQTKGPYQLWEHRHEFERIPGGTVVKDIVRYAVPGGLLEPAINRFLVHPDIRRIFEYRGAKLLEIFERNHEKDD